MFSVIFWSFGGRDEGETREWNEIPKVEENKSTHTERESKEREGESRDNCKNGPLFEQSCPHYKWTKWTANLGIGGEGSSERDRKRKMEREGEREEEGMTWSIIKWTEWQKINPLKVDTLLEWIFCTGSLSFLFITLLRGSEEKTSTIQFSVILCVRSLNKILILDRLKKRRRGRNEGGKKEKKKWRRRARRTIDLTGSC